MIPTNDPTIIPSANQVPPQPAVPTPPGSRRMHPLISIASALILILAGAYLYMNQELFRSTANPAASTAKTIGIANFRQGISSVEGLKKGLADLGYSDVTYIEQEIMIAPTLMDDIKAAYRRQIEQDKVDLLFADHEQQALAAIQLTKEMGVSVPIVYLARFHDVVEMGLAASYKSSGNNATGVAQNLVDTVARNIQFVREMAPNVKKVGIFGKGFIIPGVGDRYFDEFKKQADALSYTVVEYSTSVPPQGTEKAWNDIAATIKPGDIDALFHVPGHFYEPQERFEYALTKKLKIPHGVPVEDMPGGGVFSYSADFRAAGEQAARIVDKIFKGAQPTDIPVEYGVKSILILNEYRAKESGLTFTDTMRYLANQIITTDINAKTTAQ